MRTLSRLKLSFVLLLLVGLIYGLTVAGGLVSADPAVDTYTTGPLNLEPEVGAALVPADPAPSVYATGSFDLSPQVASALLDDSRMTVRDPGNSLQQDELVNESFEDEAFPPEFWIATDTLNVEEPELVWGRETCTSSDGQASAWALGGGLQGDTLDCTDLGTAGYTTTVESVLTVGAFDTTNYPAGLRVDHDFLLDLPRLPTREDAPYVICAIWGETDATACRFFVDLDSTDGEWASGRIEFPEAAGRERVIVAFAYLDDQQPTGQHFGVFIDNVAISGLETSGQPPRVEPAFLPMTMNKIDKEDIPDAVPIESGIVILIGNARDSDGNVINRANRFGYGTVQLCQQVQYIRQEVGTVFNVDWVIGGEVIEDLRRSFTTETATGLSGSGCIVLRNDAGDLLPLDVGEYMVRVTEEGATEPAAEKTVEITEDTPPGATPIPTQPPATPTPVATPEPGGCRNIVSNSDFEGGPYRGWQLVSNLDDPAAADPANVIIHRPDAAFSGEWLARLWGGPTTSESSVHLLNQPVELFEPGDIVSATLQFNFAMISDEEPDGDSTDFLAISFFNQDAPEGERFADPVVISEESEGIVKETWLSLSDPLDVTELVTTAPDYQNVFFVIRSVQETAVNPTTWVLDAIDLTVCTQAGVSNHDRSDNEPKLSLDSSLLLDTVSWPAPYGGAKVIRSAKPFDPGLIQGHQVDLGKLSR